MKNIVFVGSSRCFHTMDWYRSAQKVCAPREIEIITDMIEGESNPKLIRTGDKLTKLFIIDWCLFTGQSTAGNVWRNIVKLLVLPMQAILLRRLVRRRPNCVFHAHAMYYMLVCWLAGIRYIGTPQGSEILVKPWRSRLYKYYAQRALRAADHLTVDSENMQKKAFELSGKKALIIQNGIAIARIRALAMTGESRQRIVSLRAVHPLYRINLILDAREHCAQPPPLAFVYPYWADDYKQSLVPRFAEGDQDLGRLERIKLYELLTSTILAISIPSSDSSPRTVYEAIFCGCCVAVTMNNWINALPDCMRSRLVIIDLDDRFWLESALSRARRVVEQPYVPSEAALTLFDQERSMRMVAELLYQ